MGPFDLPGPQFLALYSLLLVAAIALGLIIPRLLRPAGFDSSVTEEDEMAFLAGGETRLAETVTASLLASGAIAMTSAKQITILEPNAEASPAGRAILALQAPVGWNAIAKAVKVQGGLIWRRLESRGLMMGSAETTRNRVLQTAPYLALLAFGAIKLLIGMLREKPIGLLVVLMVVTAVCALIRYKCADRRTLAGVDAVRSARLGADRMRRAPERHESGMAVALFGTGVLAGSAFSTFHAMRTSSGSSDSSSSGCSSSGCGGGGCGGCGGS